MDRKKLVQLIHIGKSKLQLDDSSYRDLVERITGKRSTTEVRKHADLVAVLDELKRLGFKLNRNQNSRVKSAHVRKVRALWITLSQAGIVRNGSDAALDAFVKRLTGIAKHQWLASNVPATNQVIEALKDMQTRAQVCKKPTPKTEVQP